MNSPMDKDGLPDYEAALNELLRKGVTPRVRNFSHDSTYMRRT